MGDPRHTGFSLLPDSSGAFEQALSLIGAEFRDDIRWEDLLSILDPYRCPERLLPWLATVFSTDVWFPEWDAARKRDVIANQIKLQRLKGTLAGLEAYIDLVDARLVRATTPPANFFLSDFTDAHHEAWLQRLPEVRIYHATRTSAADVAGATTDEPEDLADGTTIVGADPIENFLSLAGDTFGKGVFCLHSDDYPIPPDLRAVLIEGDTETELHIEDANQSDARGAAIADAERVFFPEAMGLGLYTSNDAADPSYLDSAYLHDGTDKRYAIYVRRTGQSTSKIGTPAVRGREAVDSDPTRVFLDDVVGRWFLNDPEFPAYAAVERDLLYSYYDSWRVVDPKVKGTFGPDFSFLDFDRFSIRPYTAELLVEMKEKSAVDQWFLDYGPIGFVVESDFTALENLCDVTVIASSERDRVLLDLDYARRPSIRRLYSFSELLLR